ncbi:MAG: acyl-CoA thioesterase II [Pseudomonadales bacterium]|nr:acyl-CoA thioesterase II [Pseudomonadales bacterium]
MTVMDQLLLQLDLEQIEVNLFRGVSADTGPPRVFGGQVIGQALIAAGRTVDERPCHSLHGYFLRPGDPKMPIVYEVDRIRDGKSFTTRRVVAIQKGEAIFNMSASFQVMEEGLSHQFEMPDVPPPEACSDETEAFQAHADELPEGFRRMMQERPIEMRRVEQHSFAKPSKRPPYQHAWLRTRDRLPDEPSLHQCILAYASDMGILSTCTLPHGRSFMTGLMTASLDHAMWFHRPFRVDEWILFAQDSPTSGGSRGFNRGMMFTQDGTLIASVAQEGLIRVVDER